MIIATALTTLGFQIKYFVENLDFLPDWYYSAVMAFFFVSFGMNALVTALIVYRIMTVYNKIRGFDIDTSVQASEYYGRNVNPLVSIVIESGLLTFAGQLTQSIMFKFANVAFPLIGGVVVLLYVRVSCRLLIWCFNSIYLQHRDLCRLFSLCVSRRALPTISHHGRWIQRIRSSQSWYSTPLWYSTTLRSDESETIR